MEDPFARMVDPDTGQPITLITQVHFDPKGENSYVELDDGSRLGGIIALRFTHEAGKQPVGIMTFDFRDVQIV
jgi:hypothetical protein